MVAIEHTMGNGITKTIYVSETILDFCGWSVIGIMDVPEKPKTKLVLVCKIRIGGMEIRPVFVPVTLAEDLVIH